MNSLTKTVTAIIADDEAALRTHLERLLHQLWPELKICAQAESGQQALKLILQLQPDIVFLDIRMPGLSGMDVAKKVAHKSRVVFVTAYDQYAVDAFSHHAIDYLLKPVSETRLKETVSRLQAEYTVSPEAISKALQQLKQAVHKPTSYLQWLRVMSDENIHLIHIDDVAYFKFEDKYTTVRTKEKSSLMRLSLKELEASLDPEKFWRIHRNTIVNINWVLSASENESGQLTLALKQLDDVLHVSRSKKQLFKQM